MFNKGVPTGYGSVVDQHTNHYEGIVSYLVDNTDGKIQGNGVGTLYQEKKVYKGVFGKGLLKIADDKKLVIPTTPICEF